MATTGRNYLAVDLGAESGRTIVGTLDDKHLRLTETHRFGNGPVHLQDGLHWDVLRLWSDIKAGIAASSVKFNKKLDGIGLDTWAVDFALLDKNNSLLSNPFHYRDARTDGMLDEAFNGQFLCVVRGHACQGFQGGLNVYQLPCRPFHHRAMGLYGGIVWLRQGP